MYQGLSQESEMLYGFINREGKRLGEKYHMSQCSMGEGAKDGIWLMSLDFQLYGSPLTEEAARELIINCVNDYLEAVNKDEALRPFLKTYPFKPENIKLGVFSYTADRYISYHPYIAVVISAQAKISYYTEEETEKFGFKSEKYETYDEAVAILQKEKKQSSSN